jgi:hypothetical protein
MNNVNLLAIYQEVKISIKRKHFFHLVTTQTTHHESFCWGENSPARSTCLQHYIPRQQINLLLANIEMKVIDVTIGTQGPSYP